MVAVVVKHLNDLQHRFLKDAAIKLGKSFVPGALENNNSHQPSRILKIFQQEIIFRA